MPLVDDLLDGVRIGLGWGGVGPHGRGPLGAQRDPMGGGPWEGEPLGAQKDPMGGGPGPPMGWEPLGAQGIPWEALGPPIGSLPRMSKNMKIKDLAIFRDRQLRARVPKSCARFSR